MEYPKLEYKKGGFKISGACKAAAKRKFKVYPSAYANGWATQYCRGKFRRKKKK